MVVSTRRSRDLWAGILAGPFAFALNLQSNYMLVDFACETGARSILHVVPAVSLLLVAGGALLAWVSYRELTIVGPTDAIVNGQFLALFGLLSNGLFVLLLAAQWIPTLLLHPCQR
jgi:hypothetical protein